MTRATRRRDTQDNHLKNSALSKGKTLQIGWNVTKLMELLYTYYC